MTPRDIALIALFAALTAALGVIPPITLPLGVPITAQTLGVMLAGGVLGARRGALAMALFVGLVAVGLPLLAGGRGGLGVLAGPSGGFLLGFVLGAAVVGALVERFWAELDFPRALFAALIGGVAAVYALGVPWLALIGGVPADKALIGSAAFLPGDVIKAVLATSVMLAVRRSYPIIARG